MPKLRESSEMIGCQVVDCQHNDRGETPVCKLKPEDIGLDNRGNCVSYIRDMEYLRKRWAYARVE